jgi:hypothetical protein
MSPRLGRHTSPRQSVFLQMCPMSSEMTRNDLHGNETEPHGTDSESGRNRSKTIKLSCRVFSFTASVAYSSLEWDCQENPVHTVFPRSYVLGELSQPTHTSSLFFTNIQQQIYFVLVLFRPKCISACWWVAYIPRSQLVPQLLRVFFPGYQVKEEVLALFE